MAITLAQIRGMIRAELEVGETELPNALLTSYTNQVQKEVASMLGPVVEPYLRKRVALSGASSLSDINDGAGTYTAATGVLTGFVGLTPDAYIDMEVVFEGTFTAVETAFKDVITDNDATTLTLAKNCGAGNGTAITAIVIVTPTEVDSGTAGLTLPSDCMKPIYVSDATDPATENRINVIQLDDTEKYVQNTWWASEVRAALWIGNTIRILKGTSASFPATTILTYVARPTDFSADGDQAVVSAGRLPEEYIGVMLAGIQKKAAMHLKRKDEMALAGEDMNQRVNSIMTAWGLQQQITGEESKTRS